MHALFSSSPLSCWICACLFLDTLLSLCSFFFPKDGYSMHQSCLRMSGVRKSEHTSSSAAGIVSSPTTICDCYLWVNHV
jgi:hypothetical protein